MGLGERGVGHSPQRRKCKLSEARVQVVHSNCGEVRVDLMAEERIREMRFNQRNQILFRL